MDERVRVAMAQAEFALGEVAKLAVLREPALAEDLAELVECLAGLRLDVLQLGLDRLVDDAHGDLRGVVGRSEASAAAGTPVSRMSVE